MPAFTAKDGFTARSIRDPQPVLTRTSEELPRKILPAFDAVVHLAELSNDPLGQHNPALTYSINHLGTVALATEMRESRQSRDSCTLLLAAFTAPVRASTRTSSQKPIRKPRTPNARRSSSETCLPWRTTDFSPTFLRNATAYGASPHMRFDLVLNNLAGFAWTTKEIKMTSDGTPWRPLVHVRDIAHAIACALDGAERSRSQRDLQRRLYVRELSGPRDRPNRCRHFSGCEAELWKE